MASKEATALKVLVDLTQEKLRTGKPREGIETAATGAELIRDVVDRAGATKAIAVSREAGFDRSQAKELVALATQPRTPPTPIVKAIASKSVAERCREMREAVCSFATGRWIDGLRPRASDEPIEDASTAELVARAQGRLTPSECFLLAVRVAARHLKAEFIGKALLYVLSEDFQKDLDAYANGSPRSRAHQNVRELFSHIEDVASGNATKGQIAAFSAAFGQRIEAALHLPAGQAWKICGAGPDGVAQLPAENGIKTRGTAYASADDSREKTVQHANSINRHWVVIRRPGEKLRLLFVGSPIAPADSSRMGEENKPLTKIAVDICKLQTVGSLFAAPNDHVISDMLDGHCVVEGLYSSTGSPFEMGEDIFAETEKCLLRIKENGYPPSTGRGREAWLCVLGTISSWATNHPESFPWFQDKAMQEWLEGCPFTAETVETVEAEELALMKISSTRSQAMKGAQRRRETRAAHAETQALATPAFAQLTERQIKKLEKMVESVIGEGKRYSDLGYDADCLRAMLKERDAEGIQLVVEKNKRARTVRETRLAERRNQ